MGHLFIYMKDLSAEYWEQRYLADDAPWLLNEVSPPLKSYIDQLTDDSLRILIPGGGYGDEWYYLIQKGFKESYLLDFTPHTIEQVSKRFADAPTDHLICADFFQHEGQYDLIIEQTFFCALDPELRSAYAQKCYELLGENGKLVGVYFDFPLTEKGPPFGGSMSEYTQRFSPYFEIQTLERCYNSVSERAGKELFCIAKRRKEIDFVSLTAYSQRMEKLNTGLNEETRNEIVGILKKALADTFVLFAKTKYYHWNVRGRYFTPLHELFDNQAGQLSEMMDDTAERIRALGHLSIGTLKDYLANTQLSEDSTGDISDSQMIANLLADHETVIRSLRHAVNQTAELGDAGTSDFLTGAMATHEKMAWMLRMQNL
jgi:thiopurine S-methyltransferase